MLNAADSRVGRNETPHHLHNVCSRDVSGHTKDGERGDPAIGERCSEMCDRMLANMPESFPPNRMMADLETLKEQTARILEKLEEPVEVDGPQG